MLLAILGMLGPFSVDTYIPAFSGIAKALGATPVEMQQTLSAYLLGFADPSNFFRAFRRWFDATPGEYRVRLLEASTISDAKTPECTAQRL